MKTATVPGRRGFLAKSAAAIGAVAAWPVLPRALASDRLKDDPRLAAFADTVIPGAKSDPTGAPGALEAGTLEYLRICDERNLLDAPVRLMTILGAVLGVLDLAAWGAFGRGFAKLELRKRTALLYHLQRVPGAPMLLRLLRAPFYTATVNRVGYDYLGYPGPNTGYADFSFGSSFSEPDPASVDGNLP